MTSKRKQIRLLESELENAHNDYEHTHDTMWRILTLLCEEFNMKLGMRPKSLLEEDCDD